MTFLKWITDPENNVELVTKLGYMPVKEKAFDDYLPEKIDALESDVYISLYKAFMETRDNYEFYTPPQLDTYLATETEFEQQARVMLENGRNIYMTGGGSPDDLSAGILGTLKSVMSD